jgi:uncharacterized membrane protein YvbJ
MKFCSKCGKELLDEAVVCTGCGCAVSNSTQPFLSQGEHQRYAQPTVVDEVDIGLCVLAAIIPLFGFIYWPVKHKETPKKAKACGITAIISWGIGFIFSIIWSIAFNAIWTSLMYDLFEDLKTVF